MKIELALLLMVLLAGCGGPPGPATSTSATFSQGPPPESHSKAPEPSNIPADANSTLEFIECTHYGILFAADAEAIRQLLPPGFSLISETRITTAGLATYDCEFAIVNNMTVVNRPAFAWLLVAVNPPSGTASTGITDNYVLELLANNQTLVDLWKSMGFTTALTTIHATSVGNQVTIRMQDAAGPVYEIDAGGGGASQPPAFVDEWRNHRVEANHSWTDVRVAGEPSNLPLSGLFTTHGHAAGQIAMAATSPAAGSMEAVDVNLTFGGQSENGEST